MPTYEYLCESCGESFEIQQRMSDDPLTDCECGAKGSMKKLMSAGKGLIFKGSGFYITDYKNGNNNSPSKESTASDSKTENKPSGGTESKSSPSTAGDSGQSCGTGSGCS